MKKQNPKKETKKKTLKWLLVALAHATLAIPICVYVYNLPIEIGLLIAVVVYIVVWHIYPGRFYRRMFVSMLAMGTGLVF